MASFFYDSQVKRFLIQFARIMSDWQVTYGKDQQGNDILVRVPIQYGDSSRQVSTIIANNSASNLPHAPMITYYVSGLEYDQTRTQDPYFLDNKSIRQQYYNPDSGQFEPTQGDAFTINRIMPVPYTLRITMDVWTTNTNQKLQLFEQIGTLFNPSMEVQSTDNFLDWTSLSVIYQDGITWSSRSIPVGTENPIDVLTWKFYMPIWISSPIKVKKLNIIYKVIASVFQGQALTDMQDDDMLLGTRQKITPYGYKVLLLDNTLQILPEAVQFQPPNSDFDEPTNPDTNIYWHAALNAYGTIKEGISMITLDNPYLDTEIRGTIQYNPEDDRILFYTIDPATLPQNTLSAVNSIIDPTLKGPGHGLPPSVPGQRYLIINDVTHNSSAWPGLTNGARENSIIEYQGAVLPRKVYSGIIGNVTIQMQDITGVIAGMAVAYQSNGTLIGYVTGVNYDTNVVTLDRAIPVNIDYDTTLVFSGLAWVVSFDSTAETTVEFVTNLTSGVQYRWNNGAWSKSYQGWYSAGDWNVVI